MIEDIKFGILIEQVCDEETFLIFLNSLMNDRDDEVQKEKIDYMLLNIINSYEHSKS